MRVSRFISKAFAALLLALVAAGGCDAEGDTGEVCELSAEDTRAQLDVCAAGANAVFDECATSCDEQFPFDGRTELPSCEHTLCVSECGTDRDYAEIQGAGCEAAWLCEGGQDWRDRFDCEAACDDAFRSCFASSCGMGEDWSGCNEAKSTCADECASAWPYVPAE